MLIGLMADTHDRLPFVEKAVKAFNEEGVELVLHAGDFVAPFVIPRLAELKANLIGVFGNNDGDKALLLKRASETKGKIEIKGLFAEVSADGLKMALLHGHEAGLLRSLISCGGYDVVVHGHTHQAGVRREGKTLVVNPGEVCGYLYGRSTVAILDTEKLEVKFIELR
ncbi:YfcE family phosphodiesterase [Candidatus Bathyarchaeota archaeon ex4484_135]|nr:MAG: YfcE family phosphodiesterase [Candidatus Bathyarchaeota archaeon ex4484_135]